MGRLFDNERSVFQRKINEIFKMDSAKNIVEDLIKLELLKDSEKNDKMSPVADLYGLFGPTQFSEIVELMNGRLVQFPTVESFKETVMISVYYYYKYLLGKGRKEVEEIFNDEDVPSMKVGTKVSHLHQFIQKQTQLMRSRKSQDGR